MFGRATVLLVSVLLIGGCGGEPFDLSNLEADEVAVASVQPLGEKLTASGTIRITFSQDLAAEDLDLDTYLEEPPAALNPEVAGIWKWSSRSSLEFVPDDTYLPSSRYTLSIDPRIAQEAGLRFAGTRRFILTSEPLEIDQARLHVEPVPGLSRTFRLRGTFSFNHPVASQDFAENLTVQLERRKYVEFEVETEGVRESHSFSSANITAGEKDEEISAVVSRNLRPPNATSGLAKEESRTTVIPSFRRLAIHRLRSGSDGDQRFVSVQLSHPTDPDEFASRLEIEPGVDDLRIDTYHREIRLYGDWEFSRRYAIKIDKSLVSEQGLQLAHDYDGSVFIEDLSPVVDIVGAGNYLSLRGGRKIGIQTTNVEKVTIELDRIFPNNLVPLLQSSSLRSRNDWIRLQQFGTNLYRRDLAIESDTRNVPVITPIDLNEQITADSRGLFRLTVRKADRRRTQTSRIVIATDLGILAKRAREELQVGIVSIADLKALRGVRVQLLSYNNQVLAEAITDIQGFVTFRDFGPKKPGGESGAKPFVIVATRGTDIGFLAFKETRIPTGDLDVGGVAPTEAGYRIFVYTDRGIYRPGDSVHLSWITRDADLRVPDQFPLTLRVISPDARLFREEVLSTGPQGMAEFTLDVPAWAPTGTYTLNLHLDPKRRIGSRTIRVEDFMPDRMKVDLSLRVDGEKRDLARPGEEIALRAQAMTLFGPPAAGRQASARLRLSPHSIRFPAWPDYHFAEGGKPIGTREISLGQHVTDEEGLATWDVAIPETEDYFGWLRAQAEVEVTELGGGRAIGGRESIIVSSVSHLIGLKRVTEGEGPASEYGEPGSPIPFQIILVDLDGTPTASTTAEARLFRRTWRTVLRMDHQGRYRYQSEFDEEQIDTRRIGLEASENRIDFTVDRHGSYRLLVEDAEHGAQSSLLFYVYGWGYAPWAMSAPEKVSLRLDRETYNPGERAKVQIEAPFAGQLLITVEQERVLYRKWVWLDSNSAVVEIPIRATFKPNSYVVATLLRPLDSVELHAPARAFGAAPLFIDRDPATLQVELDAPRTMRPRQKLAVRCRIPNASRQATLTLAAVDEGILQITEFETPSPLDFYFQRLRLGVESFDVWSLLLPELDRVMERSKPGGDAAIRRKNLNPIAVRRVKPVALWSGLLKGTRGWQTIEFEVPEFNGALRLMAVAADGDRFGGTERITRVRDPIVLTPNLPRFLAPGDAIEIPVQVYNGVIEDPTLWIDFNVLSRISGPARIAPGTEPQQGIALGGGSEGVVVFHAEARDSVGKARFTFEGRGGTKQVQVSTEMAVRPPRPRESRVTSGVVREGEPVSATLDSNWYPETHEIRLVISPLPVARVAAGLTYLLRYPYGCIEQTTSSCFPLLYFGDISRELAPDHFGENDALYYLNSGLDRIQAMHVPGGGFSFWPGGTTANSNPWATVYATHFLVNARLEGYVVADRVIDDSLDRLAAIARSPEGPEFRYWGQNRRLEVRAYATYVLALAGKPEKGAMENLRQDSLAQLPMSARYHLAGAYGLSGNKSLMDALLPTSITLGSEKRDAGYTWYSQARRDAVMLEVLATADPTHRHVPVLLEQLFEQSKEGRWANTQENGWAFLALGKIVKAFGGAEIDGDVIVGGETIATFDSEGAILTGSADWMGQRLRIRTSGSGFAYYSLIEEGVRRGTEVRDLTHGILVRREYLTLDGQPVDLNAIPQGEMIVARITLVSQNDEIPNVVVADLVPAGLEIENPRLMSRGVPAWAKQNEHLRIEYLDVRDDRLLLFTTVSTKERDFYYTLRAVTRGSFTLPPIKAEAMYDPSVTAIRGAGEIRVVAGR